MLMKYKIYNPLGLRALLNKLLMFNYTLGNIDSKFRSKLAAIRLLAVAKADDIDKCGVDFQPSIPVPVLKATYGINRRSKLVDFPAFDLIQQTL